VVILKAASLLEKWVIDELSSDTVITHSNTGYSNDTINLEWLKHFDRTTKKSQQGLYRLLLLDGFTSHIEYEFVKFAESNRILLFGLPPHTTHFLQPLDVVCFQPLKHYHAEAIDDAVRTGDTKFSKIEFLAALPTIRRQAFKKSTILSAFRQTGIIPYNPDKVLIPLQERVDRENRALGAQNRAQLHQEMAEEESDYIEEPSTPTLQTIKQFGQDILEELPEELSPQLAERISKYVKGNNIIVDLHKQVMDDYSYTEAAQSARAIRGKRTQRRVAGGGLITVEEARHRVIDRADKEADLEARRAEKRKKRARVDEDRVEE
jgi:DDE superfamily endonuclease